MAATATDVYSSQAPQRCSEPVGSIARPMLVIIVAPGSFERRPVRRLTDAGVPLVEFRDVLARESERTHSKFRKGKL